MRVITTNRYAAVTATLALFLSLGGTSYAVSSTIAKNSVGSKQIINGSVKSTDIGASQVKKTDLGASAVDSSKVQDNSLTGSDINESKLGTVPTAANAAVAGNAAKVNGQSVYKIRYKALPATGTQTVLDALGLKISATCAAGSDIAVTATTTKNDSSIYTVVARDSDPGNPLEDDSEDYTFDVGDNFNLLSTEDGDINLVTFTFDAPDGTVATGILTADENGSSDCRLSGHVTIG